MQLKEVLNFSENEKLNNTNNLKDVINLLSIPRLQYYIKNIQLNKIYN